MTDATHHLDDDALSAVLDGEAAPEESRHAGTCEACSARLGELREAATTVRTPVEPPPDGQRDAAIAAALAAYEAGGGHVVPMRRRRAAPAWLAAAAAVVAIALVVAVLPRGDDGAQVAGGGDEARTESDVEVADDAAGTMMAVAAPVDAGDLGALDDGDIREIVQAALDDAAARGAPESATGGGAAGDVAAIPCDEPTRTGNPELGMLVLHATGTYEGDPAVVLVYEVATDDGVDRWVYVLGVEGCVIRNQQTFSAGR